MAVSDRMVLLVRVLAVFALNAALGLTASAASGTAAAVTFGWLVPMTAVRAGACGGDCHALGERRCRGGPGRLGDHGAVGELGFRPGHHGGRRLRAVLPYLAVAAACGAIAWFATRIPKGMS